MKEMIATPSILFVQKDSIYKKMGLNCYDLDRCAFTYDLSDPVVAHPPCRLFSRLRAFSTAPICEKLCAYYSVMLIRKVGGVLEHPYPSLLFKELDLPDVGYFDRFGGFTVRVDQCAYGHKARKSTLLYICGLDPTYDFRLKRTSVEPQFVVSSSIKSRTGIKKELSHRERSATPQDFADFLVRVASNCSHQFIYNEQISHN